MGCRTVPGRLLGRLYFSPDSTRFFSPASARSMMTFSALRLIMPSIGILTSTVSRYVTSVAAGAGRLQEVRAVEGAQHLGLDQGPGDLVVAGPGVREDLVVLDRAGVHDEPDLFGAAPASVARTSASFTSPVQSG